MIGSHIHRQRVIGAGIADVVKRYPEPVGSRDQGVVIDNGDVMTESGGDNSIGDNRTGSSMRVILPDTDSYRVARTKYIFVQGRQL